MSHTGARVLNTLLAAAASTSREDPPAYQPAPKSHSRTRFLLKFRDNVLSYLE